ncbi:MAG TPA: hypothetical protein VK994_02725, partial [Bacteroidales bacterium]|nr:hypothetical protein [Bacteroidales bacterium]
MWYAEGVTEIRTIMKNGEDRTTIVHGANGTVPQVHTFTPDQKALIGVLNEEDDGKDIFKLALINIADGNVGILKDFGTREVDNLSFSADGKYLLYSKDQENSSNDDIYMMSYPGLVEVQLTNDPGSDRSPVWSRNGNEILFFSKRFGTNDLYKVKIRNGKKYEDEILLKKNVGKRIKVMGVDENNALYYVANNSRWDIYTMDMDKVFNEGQVSPIRITDLGMRSGGLAPRYSKDGRYISYVSYQSNYHDFEQSTDKNFVNKYYIGIYDTESGKHRELDIDLYENHAWADLDEYVPDWSYDGTKLVLHGVQGENYEGGIYTVDVNTAEVKPLITMADSKAWNWKRAGRHPYWSQNDEIIYYTSPDWKDLMKYNCKINSVETVFETENGFRLGGVYDDDRYCLVGKDRMYYYYDMKENTFMELFDEDVNQIGIFKGFSPDGKYVYTATAGEWQHVKELSRRAMEGDEPVKAISLAEKLPNGRMWNGSMHPSRNIFVFDMNTNIGLDIYKLEGAFD